MSNLATKHDTVTRIAPPSDVYESEKDYLLVLDVPGADGSGIDVEVDKQVLKVTAKRAQASESSVYAREFHIPPGVDVDHISANVKAGVLSVALPKRPEVRPRRINVEVH